MTDKAISPLRQRMIEDMTIRKFAPKTQHDYVQRVKHFAAFLGRSPDTASFEDGAAISFIWRQVARALTLNQSVSTLRFFFRIILGRADIVNHTQFVHEPRKLPVVLSPEEVARFLDAAPGLKYKAALNVAYGAGLRVSEVVALKVSDIDSKRMVIRIEQGKGNKDRYVMLSPHLLELLRAWYKAARPQGWLFPGMNPVNPMTTRQFRRVCHAATRMAEIALRAGSRRALNHPPEARRVSRPSLEVADIFSGHSPAWRRANAGHVSLGQLKVMSAIENCRTAALGGHVARCEKCAHSQISYNSCRNRHCPKCQGAAAKDWLAAREADLLPVPYFHVVFRLPAAIADIAYQNKAVIYDLLFKASAETLTTIAADPKHLGARVGITSVLHSWGSAMTHHPHVHMIVPGGGISLDGKRWVACRPGFFPPVRVLSRLFRRLFLERLLAAHQAGHLKFFGDHTALADPQAFAAYLAPLRRAEWVVYAKRPFGGPQAVLAYLSRHTHRVAIANSRLIACDHSGVTFRWKDYRADGRDRQKIMTLSTGEFIRRFLIHVLPQGFHRIRHYGLLASSTRADNIAQARRLLDVSAAQPEAEHTNCAEAAKPEPLSHPCPCCGGRMVIIETFQRGASPRYRPAASTAVIRIDTS